jgi:antitoxin (DNA-binding transcriptional repressor) of toxin-antitoxin stability system
VVYVEIYIEYNVGKLTISRRYPMATPIRLNSGAEMVTHKVTDLQRNYSKLIKEAKGGLDVVLTNHGDQEVTLIEFNRYIHLQNEVAEKRGLEEEIKRLRAANSLLAAGGPSLTEMKHEAAGRERLAMDEVLAQLES